MTSNHVTSIILAAGKGTRMRSSLPKPLHSIAHRSLLGHVISTVQTARHTAISVVVGPGMENVTEEARHHAPACAIYVQPNQRGTADAVLAARDALTGYNGDVFVLFADTPLIRPETLTKVSKALDEGAHVAVLGFEAEDPTGYGRLLMDANGNLLAIREHNDATADERAVRLCNSGVMAFRCPDLVTLLDKIGTNNAKHEYFLTDIIEIARRQQLKCRVVSCDQQELLGINDRSQLAEAQAVFQTRARLCAMLDGATLIDPATVWFAYDTTIGQDVIIEPNVFFGPGVTVGNGVHIRANSHIEGATIGPGARIGPYARLRPGTELGAHVHIGNFVEVKNVVMGDGAKANHLAYLGDGSVGASANIGAGTIFCNYDGFNKHRTEIEDGAFIGSNSSLVAPLRIGRGAMVGSGSVITRNVAGDSLALERNQQIQKDGWAARFRAMMMRSKS